MIIARSYLNYTSIFFMENLIFITIFSNGLLKENRFWKKEKSVYCSLGKCLQKSERNSQNLLVCWVAANIKILKGNDWVELNYFVTSIIHFVFLLKIIYINEAICRVDYTSNTDL